MTTPDGNTIALTAGDVDEAVSGILKNGLVASDVNGESVPSGFSRIDAFRVGVLGDTDAMLQALPVVGRAQTFFVTPYQATIASDIAVDRVRNA